MKVLLIRHDPMAEIEIKNAIQDLGFTLYDVNRHEQILISEINNTDKCGIYFFNIHISKFDRIYFFNTPDVSSGNPRTAHKENTFEYCEMDASVVSALQQYPDKLINAGTLNMSLSIKNRYFLIFLFKNIGWALHASLFNLTHVIHDKTEYRFYMVITRHSHSFYPYNDIYTEAYRDAEELIFKTQKAMWDRKIDILNVTCVVLNGTFFIVNVSEHFQNISNQVLCKSLKEII